MTVTTTTAPEVRAMKFDNFNVTIADGYLTVAPRTNHGRALMVNAGAQEDARQRAFEEGMARATARGYRAGKARKFAAEYATRAAADFMKGGKAAAHAYRVPVETVKVVQAETGNFFHNGHLRLWVPATDGQPPRYIGFHGFGGKRNDDIEAVRAALGH